MESYDTLGELTKAWEQNLIATAEAVGVSKRHIEGDTEDGETKAFKAALGGGDQEAVNKAQKQAADADDVVTTIERIDELIHHVAEAAGVSEKNIVGEIDPDTDETKAFKSALSGRRQESSTDSTSKNADSTDSTDASAFKEALGR